MRDRLILLPGWGFAPQALLPLSEALQSLDPQLDVQLEPLPPMPSHDVSNCLDVLDAALPSDVWLGGWSLGGMLAAELAAHRGERCGGLLTLASNACFVARADWPWAMAQATFDGFLASCEADPRSTLKRFALLCAQGGADVRGLSRLLGRCTSTAAGDALTNGLQLLAQLDSRSALQRFQGPQLHLLAAQDALVPAQVAGALSAFRPGAQVSLIERASHAFVLEDPAALAAVIHAFLHGCPDE